MTRARLKVLFASTQSHLPQRAGGIESSTHDLCKALEREGDSVAVLAAVEPHGFVGLSNRVRRKLPFGPQFPADRTTGYPVFRGWHPIEGASEVARRFDPSIAVTQGPRSVPFARAFLDLGVPTALYLRDVEFDRLGGDVPRDTRLLVIANSRFTAERAGEAFGVEVHVVPPLVRPEAYRTDGPSEAGRVLYVNPHPWKGVETAFDLARRRPDIPFTFLETWKLQPERERAYRARAEGLPNVEWHERVGDMREMYARAKVLLVPSLWEEAWGRVATEAQISGIPVLASDRGGLPESVGPGGLLVDPDAPPVAWEEALARIWDDPAEFERLSGAAREHSRRLEIRPEVLVARLRELLAAHAMAAPGQDRSD